MGQPFISAWTDSVVHEVSSGFNELDSRRPGPALIQLPLGLLPIFSHRTNTIYIQVAEKTRRGLQLFPFGDTTHF